MAVNSRVRQPDFTENAEAFEDDYMLDLVRGKWQIFEGTCEYNSLTGGHVRKGPVVRRYDPDVKWEQEGKPGRWATKAEALAYAEKWLTKKTKRTTHHG